MDRYRLSVAAVILVDEAFGFVYAVRHIGHPQAAFGFGFVENPFRRPGQDIDAEFVIEFVEPAFG